MFRVATYNVGGGLFTHLPRFIQIVGYLRPDILALNEADDERMVKELAAHFGLHTVWARGSGNHHLATLSRYPIESWQSHTQKPLTQAALMTRLLTPAGPLTIYNLHLLPYLLLPFELRRWQAVGRLLQIINQSRPEPHLILGDLNAIAPGDRVLHWHNPPRMKRVMALQLFVVVKLALPRLLRAGYCDCYRHLNPAQDGFTFLTGNPTTRYDYILADGAMSGRLQSCQVMADHPTILEVSDHYPLLATFVG